MKYALSLVLGLVLSVAAYAQGGPAFVTNNTGCTFRVDVSASDASCVNACFAGSFCIFPGQTVPVTPCGPFFWSWSIANVIPMDDACSTPCNFGAVQVAPNGCAPVVAANVHCHCGPYTAVWTSPFTLDLF